jgi:hypothetical protein
MAFLLHQDRFIPALKKMPHTLMPPVEKLGVDPVQLPHPSGKISPGGFHDQMIMILHETVGMAKPFVSAYDRGKDIQKAIPIRSIQKNRLPGVSPTGNMINGSSEFDPQWPSHTNILSF